LLAIDELQLDVLSFQSGPEVLMHGSLTLTVVFVDWNLWEAEGADDCVPEGLDDCVPKGLPVCIVEVVATFHAVMAKGGSKGFPPLEHVSPKAAMKGDIVSRL
jgi:hypothetical protein